MSTTTVLCAYCESLPERVPGRTAKIIRCPLCKTNLEVTPAGAKYRVSAESAEAAPAASRWRRWTARALGLGACFAVVLGLIAAVRSTAPRETPAQPAAQARAPAPAVQESLTRTSDPPAIVVEPAVKAAASPYFPPGEPKAPPYVPKHRALVPKNAPVRAAAPEVLPVTTVLAREAAPEPDWTSELLKVPEVSLHAPTQRPISKEAARKAITDTTELARERDKTAQDGFIRALQKERDDLAGLPFLLGDKCRLQRDAAKLFQQAVLRLRSMGVVEQQTRNSLKQPFEVAKFWQSWSGPYRALSPSHSHPSVETQQNLAVHGVAAMTQILGPAPEATRLALVDVLAGIEHPTADEALIKCLLYDLDAEVRERAVQALASRPPAARSKSRLRLLAQALSYPWAVVAERAAQALVRLGGGEATPLLTDFVDAPDPAAPFVVQRCGTKRMAVREVVRINHLRNCQLCHPPAVPASVPDDVLEGGLVGVVPLSAEKLPPSFRGYSPSMKDRDIVVRADVTYLRQDFSVMLPVEDSGPWPKMQRFDFLVRTRVLNDSEAAVLRDRLPLSPQHQAALAALRELTGSDFGWRAVGRQMPGARGGPMPSAPTAWAALPQAPPRAEVMLRAAE